VLPTSGESSLKRRQPAATSAEVLLSVAAATGLVALLDKAAPIAGLGVVYLLAVLLIAIRRGELAALATAVLSVLALNYFFIEPRHRLTISDSENVVALGVLLIAAIVVGRLAATAREQAREAEERAGLAAAREREAAILAEAASAVLAGGDLEGQLRNLSASVAASTSEALRVKLTAAPPEATGGEMVPLSSQRRPGWIWAAPDSGWARNDLERVAEPLGRLIDIAHEHERISSRFAESEATRRADAAKTALLHAISHDLRSPLTAITTAAAGLRAGSISETDRRELHSVIDDESDRLARLVDDLLDVSRIQAGAVNPRTDWCDLSDLTASAAAGVRARLGDHPIDFDLPPDLPLVQADAAQLERVFSNLLENAIRFSPEDEPVRISGGTGGRKVIVRVTDQGRGIAPARQAEVFEPFVGGRDGHAGSGLGLAICRGLVEANGGTIRLQSTPGLGTSFAVAFPLLRQPAPAR
jgi:two-component system, OmpR family, sensor histidine kinase KdpD